MGIKGMTESIERLFQGFEYIGSATASRYQTLNATPFLDSRQRLANGRKSLASLASFKNKLEEGYKMMAADEGREQEAKERCNGLSGKTLNK